MDIYETCRQFYTRSICIDHHDLSMDSGDTHTWHIPLSIGAILVAVFLTSTAMSSHFYMKFIFCKLKKPQKT